MFYVGLDVSVARTAVCIMDAAGQVILERSVESTPETIAATIRASGKEVDRVGLEAGINSAWIARGLGEAKLTIIAIDATHAAAALKTALTQQSCHWPPLDRAFPLGAALLLCPLTRPTISVSVFSFAFSVCGQMACDRSTVV